MPRLLLDEMYPAALARTLRERGVDAEAVDGRAPLRGLGDEELLVIAARERRALMTETVADFMRLYGEWGAAGRNHSGIVIALSSRFTRRPAGRASLVEATVELCSRGGGGQNLADAVHFLAVLKS